MSDTPETDWEFLLMQVVIAGINLKLKDGQPLTEAQQRIFETAPKELFIPENERARPLVLRESIKLGLS